MITRDGANGIVAWDGTGNVKLTSTLTSFFCQIEEETYFSAEGVVKNMNEIEIKLIEIRTDANDDTLVSNNNPNLK